MLDIDFIIKALLCIPLYLVFYKFGEKLKEKRRLKELPIKEYEKKIIDSINRFDGRDFELFMGFIFEQLGYKSTVSQATRDGGKDIILKDGKGAIYVECKRYASQNKISRPLIQKLVGASVCDGIDRCYFVTTSDFTDEALEYANNCMNVEISLLNLDGILDLCKKCDYNTVARWLGYDIEYQKLSVVK